MLTPDQLRHLANLAKIEFTDAELETFGKDLNQILEYVDQIKDLKLEGTEGSVQPLAAAPLREDKPRTNEEDNAKIAEQIISNFPEREGNYLKVPKIIEK